MAKRARRASPSRRYYGWVPNLFPEGPDGRVPEQTTIKAVFMSRNNGPAVLPGEPEAEGPWQFFLVDSQEMGYFTVSQDLRPGLPEFAFQDLIHVVLKIQIKSSKRLGVDGHLVQVLEQKDMTEEIFGDLFDVWVNKTWGPA